MTQGMDDVTTRRKLVLLTNQYPYVQGDHVFVESEVAALAARFDEVEIFNYTPGTSTQCAALLPNVTYGGNLYGSQLSTKVRALASPALLGKSCAVGVKELRAGRLKGHWGRFLSAVAVGMTLAHDSRLRHALVEPNTDVSVYSFWGMGAGLVVPWLPKAVKTVTLRLHRYDLYEEESGYLPFRTSMFSRAENILAISEAAKRYLIESYPGHRLNNKVILSRLGSAVALETQAQPIENAGEIIVSCSNLIAVKRVDRIVDMLETIPLEKPLTWIHFGGGVLEHELKSRASQLDRPGLTIEIRGAIPHSEIIEFYRSHKVSAFLNVSASEGVPVSIMEAISYGIPVVATDVGGTAEIVGSRLKTGELIPANFTADELAGTLLHVVAAPPQTYAPKELWAQRYNASINAQATASLIARQR